MKPHCFLHIHLYHVMSTRYLNLLGLLKECRFSSVFSRVFTVVTAIKVFLFKGSYLQAKGFLLNQYLKLKMQLYLHIHRGAVV